MSATLRKVALGLGVTALALAVVLAAAPAANAQVWWGPNAAGWQFGQWGTQYKWDNNGGFYSQGYSPFGGGVYEQNQWYRGQRTWGPNGNHGWVESPWLPGVRLTW